MIAHVCVTSLLAGYAPMKRIAPSAANPAPCVMGSGHANMRTDHVVAVARAFVSKAGNLIDQLLSIVCKKAGPIMLYSNQFLEAVTQHVQPEGRAQHLAGTLPELLACVPEGVTLADLVAGWQLLARPHGEHEEAPVAHRRTVCAELAAIGGQLTRVPGTLAGAVTAWDAWQDAAQGSADSRLAAMAKPFARECVELRSAL